MFSTLTLREMAQAYWDTEAERDLDALMEFFHPEAIMETPNGILKGRENIRTFYAPMFEEYPGLRVRIVRDVVNGEWAVFEYDAVLIDKNGGEAPLQGCNIVRIVNGQYVYLRGIFDPSKI